MTRLPHTLHLTIDSGGWLNWRLECPYSATEVDDQPGRPCNMAVENPVPWSEDTDGWWEAWWEAWVPVPGCFAVQWLDEAGFEDSVHLNVTDPSFPMLVDVKVDGSCGDATAVIVPWEGDR